MSELYMVAVLFKASTRQVNLIFESGTHAQQVYEALERLLLPVSDAPGAKAISVVDDYGTKMTIMSDVIESVLYQENGRALDGAMEIELQRVRAQSKAQRRAQADPSISKGGPPLGMQLPPGFGTRQ